MQHTRVIQVWDWPLRLSHWLLAVAVIGAIITVKIGGNAMIWHERFGWLALGCVVFRVQWGFLGSHHARFRQFLPNPWSIREYWQGRWQGLGHNPLGALSVYALLFIVLLQAMLGLFSNDDIAFRGSLVSLISGDLSHELSSWHRRLEPVVFALIGLHLLAVLIYTLRGKGILLPMIHGKKEASAEQMAYLQNKIEPMRSQEWRWLPFGIALLMTLGCVWLAAGGLITPPAPAPVIDLGW